VAALVLFVVGAWVRSSLDPGGPDPNHPTTTVAALAGHPPVAVSVTCDTAAGDLTTDVVFRLLDRTDPVTPGSTLRVELVLPFVQVRPPVPVTFVTGTVRLPVPEGLRVTDASMTPASNIDFTSAGAAVGPDGREVVIDLEGSFPMDGTPRNVPVLVLEGVVEAPSGAVLRFPQPTEVLADADAGLFGSQRSTCRSDDPAPIAEIPVG
jgi:hypothetical protein